MPAGQPGQQRPGLGGERLLGPVAGAVQPPDVAARAGVGQGMQHGQHRSRADTGADQQDRRIPRLEDEGAAWRGDIQHVTRVHARAHEAAPGTVRLPFDADPVGIGARIPGQRVAAQQRRRCLADVQAQGEELARQGGRHGCSRRIGQVDRDHRLALPLGCGHHQRAEPWPGRRRAHRRQARVAPAPPGASAWSSIAWNEVSPSGGQRGDPQRPRHLLAGMPGQVQQRVDLRDRHRFGPRGHLHDLIPGLDGTLAQHPEVEPGPVMRDQQRRDLRVVHPDADPVAGDSRLGHLEQRLPDPVPVADAHPVIAQAVDGEVLPELAVR